MNRLNKLLTGILAFCLVLLFLNIKSTYAQTVPPTNVTFQINFGKDDVNEDGTIYTNNGTVIFLGTGQTVGGGYTGLRFNNVNIPAGATITSAHLEVVSPTGAWNQLSFDIYGEATGNSAGFISTNKPSQRSLTSSKVSHSSDANWLSGATISLNEMNTVIQEIVNRPDWAQGNSMSVILKGTGGSWSRKFVSSYEGSTINAPKLVISYTTSGGTPTPTPTPPPTITPSPTPTPIPTATPTPSPTPTPTPSPSPTPTPTPSPTPSPTPTPPPGTTVTGSSQIGSGVDDVNEDGSTYTSNGTSIFLGTGSTTGSGVAGLRFNNVNIPAGATISSAHFEVVSPTTAWNRINFDIFAEATGSSSVFASNSKPSSRTLTLNKVSHSSDVNWPAGATIALNEIKSVIQEVVSRSDWSPGNSLSLILKGTGGAWARKFVTSFEGSTTNAPKLIFTYSTASASPTPSPTPSPNPIATTITSIASGSTVSNTITIAADATPSASVAGVKFMVDNQNAGSEDTTSPYSATFDTTTIPDGAHTLKAIARDTSGATYNASPVTVTVDNTNKRPNIVFIMTDDQTFWTMPYMPITTSLFNSDTVKFDSATVTTSTCCPSRSTFLSGLYSHNTGVFSSSNGPNGGALAFKDKSTIATWLNSAGYRTGLIGKYLNGYDLLGNYIPPGWSDWHALVQGDALGYYNAPINENGLINTYGSAPTDYSTDVLKAKAVQFIQNTPSNQPLFLVYTPYAPHSPHIPAPQDVGLFSSLPPFRPPSYNESDVSNKPAWIQALPPISTTDSQTMDAYYQSAQESLQAVDRAVQDIFNTLSATGRLNNTLVVFTSDNGVLWGGHRVQRDKDCVYEECSKIPLWVYKTGFSSRIDSALVQNIDYAPTFADLAHVIPTSRVNGVSILPRLTNPGSAFRTESLLETLGEVPMRNFQAVRTNQYVYAEYQNGDKEFYDYVADPFELDNKINVASYSATISSLQNSLNTLKNQ